MTKRSALLPCLAISAVIAACSGSTAPSSSNSPQPPSSASKGQEVNFTGTYDLSYLVSNGQQVNSDANDGGTLTLTSTAYQLSWTGSFASGGNTDSHGSYVATDTSSTAQRGTLALYDSVAAKTENATYSYSGDTLVVTIPNSGQNANETIVTYWIQQ
jgi:hypothetical protein